MTRKTWSIDIQDASIRHRHGMPWFVARVPHRWHSCRPQTVQLYRDGGVLTGTCYCACGAATDHTGRWHGRNTRRPADPAGLRRDPRTPQPDHTRVATGTVPHPGARRHPRTHRGEA